MTFKELNKLYQGVSFSIRVYLWIRFIIFDFKKLLDFIPSDVKKIQEIGCGYGMASFMMAKQSDQIDVQSYDLDDQRISSLKRINTYPNLHFYAKNAVDIDRFDVDVVIMADLLHHLTYDQQKVFLKKIRETLGKKTRVIVKDMDKGKFSFRQIVNFLIDVVQTREFKFFYHSNQSFVELFQCCGFKVRKKAYANRWFIPLNHIIFVLEPV